MKTADNLQNVDYGSSYETESTRTIVLNILGYGYICCDP